MMIDFNQFLNIILYVCLTLLVIIFIVLGIKLIMTLNKVDKVIDDVNTKMSKIDGLFDIVDKTTDFASSISDKVINGLSGLISGLIKRKKGNDEDE